MKRIIAACLMQTICFQPKSAFPSDFNKQQTKKEYSEYKKLMERYGTKYQILEEVEKPDGSIVVKLKKQNNGQPLGEYFD